MSLTIYCCSFLESIIFPYHPSFLSPTIHCDSILEDTNPPHYLPFMSFSNDYCSLLECGIPPYHPSFLSPLMHWGSFLEYTTLHTIHYSYLPLVPDSFLKDTIQTHHPSFMSPSIYCGSFLKCTICTHHPPFLFLPFTVTYRGNTLSYTIHLCCLFIHYKTFLKDIMPTHLWPFPVSSHPL